MQLIAVGYYLVALVAALILLNAYKKKTTIGDKIGKVMLATFLLVVFYSFQLTLDYEPVQSIALSLYFVATDIMIIFFYQYILEFIGWKSTKLRNINIAIYAYAVIDSLLFALNPFNGFTLDYMQIPMFDGYVLGYIPKIPFFAHTLYVILIILFIVALLILKCSETPSVYWRRYYMLIVGVMFVIAVNLFNLYFSQTIALDFSSLLYCIIGILMYINTFSYLPKVTLNITRRMILSYLSEPIVLFDYEGKLADYSNAILYVAPSIRSNLRDITLEEFVDEAGLTGFRMEDADQEFEWNVTVNGEARIYTCKFRCMRDSKNRIIGKIFVFNDITSMRRTYFDLEQSQLYDSVTGLYNKASYLRQVPQWSLEKYWPVAMITLNINGLRNINEIFGPTYGDRIMRQLAWFVKNHCGSEAFCAKLDGGNVVAVIENTNHEMAANIGEQIKWDMENFYAGSEPIFVEYGVAVKDRSDRTMEHILADAKTSMQNKKMLQNNSKSSSLVDSLRQTLSESDYETEEHVERTREMSFRLGKAMGLSDSEIGKLELLALLHDIGKVAIPHQVLLKKGRLNDEEFEIMKQHTVKGYRIAMASPELAGIAECILSHHEKWDGTGYPNKLKGENIPLLARIISCVDSHDVMVHNRPYHQAMPEEKAIAELRRCSGTQFDPNIIEIFTRLLEEEEMPKILKQRQEEKVIEV